TPRRRAASARRRRRGRRRRRPAGCARGRRSLLGALQALGLLGGGESVDQLVEVALHHRRQPVQGEADPVVGDARLREVVGADALAPLAGAHLTPAVGGDGGGLLLLRALEAARLP